MKIDTDKKYRTRDGRMAEALSEESGYIRGFLTGEVDYLKWDMEGRAFPGRESDLDLFPAVTPHDFKERLQEQIDKFNELQEEVGLILENITQIHREIVEIVCQKGSE